MDNIKAIIETTLKAEIVKALNSAPDAIEKLVTAAISAEVGATSGRSNTEFYEKKVPYLDYLIGNEIRSAAREAVMQVFKENRERIHEAVRARFSAEHIVDGFASALIKASEQEWRINVSFEGEERR